MDSLKLEEISQYGFGNQVTGISDSKFSKNKPYINGVWISSPELRPLEVYDPGTNEKIGEVECLDLDDVNRAIESASLCFEKWKNVSAAERGKIIRRWGELILKNKKELATIITLEEGKPLSESVGEIEYGAGFAEWFAEEGKRAYGEWIPPHLAHSRSVVKKEPVGVVAAITPWNFPSAMIVRKAAAAMAAGCTFLVKPSPETPFSALALANLAEEAGFPAGLFSVLIGNDVMIGKALSAHPAVKKLTFTGSTATGGILYEMFAGRLKKFSAELGGHAPFIVFADSSLEEAAEAAVAAKFQTSGQDCLAVNRILVERKIYPEFCELFKEKARSLKVGHGLSDGVDVGPLINGPAVRKCEAQVTDAVAKGAEVILGGSAHAAGRNFFSPTVLTGLSREMDIFTQETFGPVAPIMAFDTEEEALSLANDSEFGLAAYVYSENYKRVWKFAESLQYGMVACNTPRMTGPPIPFGGVKNSGFGREGSKYGLEDFMNIKYMCFGGLN